MTRMKISLKLGSEKQYSAITDVHYLHSKYNLKCKDPEFNLFAPSTLPPMRQIPILQHLKPSLHVKGDQEASVCGPAKAPGTRLEPGMLHQQPHSG